MKYNLNNAQDLFLKLLYIDDFISNPNKLSTKYNLSSTALSVHRLHETQSQLYVLSASNIQYVCSLNSIHIDIEGNIEKMFFNPDCKKLLVYDSKVYNGEPIEIELPNEDEDMEGNIFQEMMVNPYAFIVDLYCKLRSEMYCSFIVRIDSFDFNALEKKYG